MEDSLIKIGSQLVEIRRLFDWKQEDLAKKIGISRPTIIGIEKDPSKMTRTVALALTMMILIEIERREEKLNELQFELWDDKKTRENLIKKISGTGLSASFNSSLLPGILTTVVGMAVGGLLISKLPSIFSNKVNVAESDTINSKNLKRIMEESLKQLKERLTYSLRVDTLSVKSIMNLFEEA